MAKSQDQYNIQFLDSVYFKEFHKDQFLVLYSLILRSMIYFFGLKGIEICNFADDITPYICDSNLKSALETLEHNSDLAIVWFEMNYMKLNSDKCNLLVSGNQNGQISAKLDSDIVWKSNDVKK